MRRENKKKESNGMKNWLDTSAVIVIITKINGEGSQYDKLDGVIHFIW